MDRYTTFYDNISLIYIFSYCSTCFNIYIYIYCVTISSISKEVPYPRIDIIKDSNLSNFALSYRFCPWVVVVVLVFVGLAFIAVGVVHVDL